MNDGTFDLNVFIAESKEVLLNPKSYFSRMKTSGGLTEPIVKSAVYGAVTGAVVFLWSILKIGTVTGGLLSRNVGISSLITCTLGAVVGMFIGAVILLVISSVCRGNTDFEATVRVMAATMVLLPVTAFVGFTGHINFYFGFFADLAVNIYALWLLYNALIVALKSKPETTKIVMYILVAIFVIIMLAGLGAKRRTDQFMNEFNSPDLRENTQK